MPISKSYAALSPQSPLQPYSIPRRDHGPDDVVMEILYCGICHSDIHQARDEWGGAKFPMVPGHEVVGRVVKVGKKVKRHRPGDIVGVGCFVDSCGKCSECRDHEEQFCVKHCAFTYNSTEKDGVTPTYGGYSESMVVREPYVLKIGKSGTKLPYDRIAPLLCAGITTYSPLKRHGVKKGDRVGVVGLGGLGHMAVKIAKGLGAHVTVFSTSAGKENDAKKLGAKDFVLTRDLGQAEQAQRLASLRGKFDFILDTVSAPHDLNLFLGLLRKDGAMALVGVPTKPAEIQATSVIFGRKKLTGSLIGGIKETQEMLNFCLKKKIFADVEVIAPEAINDAYERMLRSDVKYRFVIDCGRFR